MALRTSKYASELVYAPVNWVRPCPRGRLHPSFPNVYQMRSLNSEAQSAAGRSSLPESMLFQSAPPIQYETQPVHQGSKLTKSNPLLAEDTTNPQQTPTRHRAPPPSKQHKQPPLKLTPSVRALLPHLASQPPFYAVIHIHSKPYLVTAGDTIRLPFLMHGVLPGDTLRLNRATRLGSRDYSLLGGPAFPDPSSEEEITQPTTTAPIVGRTEDLPHTPYPGSSTDEVGRSAGLKKKGPAAYVDERMFVCRAVVMGVEAEPMRVKEKTKRRQRHVRRVKSKHKFTVLRVKTVGVKKLEELEGELSTNVEGEVNQAPH